MTTFEDLIHASDRLQPVLITAALTGAIPQKSKYPTLPISPEEIAEQAILCAQEGASIVHLHTRDDQGLQTQDPERLSSTISMIRSEVPDLVICATTTSRGARSFEDRLTPLKLPQDLLPDLASLTLGSYNTPFGVNLNPKHEILELAAFMDQVGVSPEVEIFDIGMLYTLFRMMELRQISKPSLINILLGVEGACPANARELNHIVELVPAGFEWAVAGIGKYQRTMIELGVQLGGNLRVGMEDNPRGEFPGWSNVDSVRMAAQIAKDAGRPIGSTAEARLRLNLASRVK